MDIKGDSREDFVSEQSMAFVPHKNGLKENAERHKRIFSCWKWILRISLGQ